MASSQTRPFQEILVAAKNNDFRKMSEIVQENPMNARAANQIGQTALHVAAIWGHVEVSNVLLIGGADVNAMNQFGLTPLHGAVQGDHVECVELLIESGADKMVRAGNGLLPADVAKSDAMRVALGVAALEGHAAANARDHSALDQLLSAGKCTVSDQDSDGNTILHLAVQSALGETMDLSGAGFKMLDLVLNHEHAKGLSTAQSLLNNDGLTPLHVAAKGGSVAVCEALLQSSSAPPGVVNLASRRRDKLHNGQWGKKNESGDLEIIGSADSTPLHMTVQALHDAAELAQDEDEEEFEADVSLVSLLLRHGADANAVDVESQTPLHIAIAASLHGVVRLLLEAKADMSLSCTTFGKNNTALHQATIHRDAPMVELLVAHGADVDAQGRDGWTPLGLAVRSNNVAVAKTLLQAKASPDADCNGKTPLELATTQGKQALVSLLQAAQIS